MGIINIDIVCQYISAILLLKEEWLCKRADYLT